MTLYTARMFGPFTVLRDGETIGSGGSAPSLTAARTLLKWFLIHPQVSFSSDELADVIAPGKSNPRNRLNRTLHALRDYLEPDRGDRSSVFIKKTGAGYVFDPGGSWEVDFWQARRLISAARQARQAGDIEAAIRDLETVAQLDARVFLPEDIYTEAFADTRAAQERACRDARVSLLRLYLSSDMLPQALASALAMLDQDPYDEAAVMTVAVAHAMGGDRFAGIQILLEFRDRLNEDLGISPSSDVHRLVDHLRSGDPIRVSPAPRLRRD